MVGAVSRFRRTSIVIPTDGNNSAEESRTSSFESWTWAGLHMVRAEMGVEDIPTLLETL